MSIWTTRPSCTMLDGAVAKLPDRHEHLLEDGAFGGGELDGSGRANSP
jgi:hypothetical protein